MNDTQVERTRRLRESHSKKGLKQVTVWVPVDKVIELKLLAIEWRIHREKREK
tara:strand:- start:367 stop:525 length:159 start_codon:yes stop_codon:yes gene_type:complete